MSPLHQSVVDFIEDDEPLTADVPVIYPCVRCGAEVGVPLFEYCEACLEPDPDVALSLQEDH